MALVKNTLRHLDLVLDTGVAIGHPVQDVEAHHLDTLGDDRHHLDMGVEVPEM